MIPEDRQFFYELMILQAKILVYDIGDPKSLTKNFREKWKLE